MGGWSSFILSMAPGRARGLTDATHLFIFPWPSSGLLPLFTGTLQQPLLHRLDLTPGIHGSGSQGGQEPPEPRRPPRGIVPTGRGFLAVSWDSLPAAGPVP